MNVIKTLNLFFKSPEQGLRDQHIPKSRRDEMSAEAAAECVKHARAILQSICEREVTMTFDAYLKFFAVLCMRNRASLHTPGREYDFILVDEGQDLNPPMEQVIAAHVGGPARVILVGDPHQSIYSFNNCRNALRDDGSLDFFATFHLTGTFRSRGEVTSVGGAALRVLKKERRPYVGLSRREGKVICPCVKYEGDSDGEVAHVFRYNRTLFKHAATLAVSGVPFCTSHTGGQFESILELVRGCWYLMVGGVEWLEDLDWRVQQRFQGLSSWGDLESSIGTLDDDDLETAVGITKDMERKGVLSSESGSEAPILGKMLHHRSAASKVFLTTCHRAKGHEWNDVWVADDFLPGWEHGGFDGVLKRLAAGGPPWQCVLVDELNLVYVAVTRARRNLFLGPRLGTILQVLGN